MTNILKAGKFSDGGYRMRVVENGYDCDPAPSDETKIIFDSDWGELFPTKSGWFGSTSIYGNTPVSVSFPSALGYVPFVLLAWRCPGWNDPNNSSTYNTFLASVYSTGFPTETYTDHFAYTPNLVDGGGTHYSGTLLWMVILSPSNVTPPGGSRAGTNWMKWTAEGPVVTKPGKDCSSTDATDFLIPPGSAGYVLNPAFMTGQITTLDYVRTDTISSLPHKICITSVSHGLGYLPFCFGQSQYDYIFNPANLAGGLAFDSSNIYTYTSFFNDASTGNVGINPLVYVVTKTQWA